MLFFEPGGEGVIQTGGTAMEAKVGDTVRSILNGMEYKVKKVVKNLAFLESQDGKSKIVTEVDALRLFYREKEDDKA